MTHRSGGGLRGSPRSVHAQVKNQSLVNISEIVAPSRVNPGQQITARVTIENGAGLILSTDPDRCQAASLTPGYEIKANVTVGPAVGNGRVCVAQRETVDVTFRAPQSPGTYDIRADIFGGNSDNYLGTDTAGTLTVIEPTGGGGDDPNTPDGPGDSGPTGDGLLARFQRLDPTTQGLIVLGTVGGVALLTGSGDRSGRPRR